MTVAQLKVEMDVPLMHVPFFYFISFILITSVLKVWPVWRKITSNSKFKCTCPGKESNAFAGKTGHGMWQSEKEMGGKGLFHHSTAIREWKRLNKLLIPCTLGWCESCGPVEPTTILYLEILCGKYSLLFTESNITTKLLNLLEYILKSIILQLIFNYFLS